MDVLPYNFRACRICGIWNEGDGLSIPVLIHKVAILFVILQFTASQIIEMAVMQGTVDELMEVLFLTFTYIALCLKVFNFMSRRDEMCSLLSDFRLPFCRAKSAEEDKIIQGYSRVTANIFLSILALSWTTGIVMVTTPLLDYGSGNNTLPLKSFHFYDISSTTNFWIAYILQTLALAYGVFLNVSMDTMAYGFIIMVTAQFELNCHRLLNGTTSTKESITHHVVIQDIVSKIQHYFIRVIVPLFCFSLITLCASIFQMSQTKIASFEFLFLALYLGCMLCQVFFYCWFGNELELKAKVVMDAIYSSNWTDYSTKERKDLWFIMLSSQNDSSISFHGQCGLTLNTFLWIVKTSYATFNLLQRV